MIFREKKEKGEKVNGKRKEKRGNGKESQREEY